MPNCVICNNPMLALTDGDNVREVSPVISDRCVGCWVAEVELEKFLVRAVDRTVMGNWTFGWLKAIIQDPKRYL